MTSKHELVSSYPSSLCPTTCSLHYWLALNRACRTPSPGFWSVRMSNDQLHRVALWQARTNGSLCGDNAFGIWSIDSAGLAALADFAGFGEDNDGAVPTAPCHPPNSTVTRSPQSSRFTAAVNHFDLACRHGDGFWGGDERKPCMWYLAMSSQTA